MATAALFGSAVAETIRTYIGRGVSTALGRSIDALRTMHSGHVGDYVVWLTVGVAILGVAFSFALR